MTPCAPTTVTQERAQALLFTEGYLWTELQFGIRRGTPPIRSEEDLRGKTISVNKGTPYEQWVNNNRERLNLTLLAFARDRHDSHAHAFAFFIIAVAAAEAAVGLAIVVGIYRNRKSVNIDELSLMKN